MGDPAWVVCCPWSSRLDLHGEAFGSIWERGMHDTLVWVLISFVEGRFMYSDIHAAYEFSKFCGRCATPLDLAVSSVISETHLHFLHSKQHNN